MNAMKELKTIVRTESVARLMEALGNAGVTRFWVSHGTGETVSWS